ncbi:MAG: GNAT family N-acetyltransferase [Defluviitaleaceae bacterium]|nr:GNAT family N-acetyltransferase [Defluviitaleaceae bacterium]
MTTILGFDKNHIEKARELALASYNEERSVVTALPQIDAISEDAFTDFTGNGLGVAMLNGDKLLGFMCCEGSWENAFDSTATGVFVPLHAHGAIPENRGGIYKRLYQAAAELWVGKGIAYHGISLYTHDSQAKDAFFSCGFGLRCVDAVRPLTNFEHPICEGIVFEELANPDVIKEIRNMKNALSIHLGESPCFMRSSPADRESWIARTESRESRLFTAMYNGLQIAYIDVKNDGENFATWEGSVQNICGAFCLPEYRGKGIMQGLLNHVITQMKSDKVSSLGIDFESFNLSSNGFWLKHFTSYASSVTRRIDECAFTN